MTMNFANRSPDYPRQILALTSLRFFAAYWVVLHHLDDALRPNIDAYSGLLRKGYLAVDVFFILSGFILCHVYWKDGLSGRLDYWNFLSKRLARIYPMHIVTMALMGLLVAIGVATGVPVDATADLGNVMANLLLIHAWGTTPGLSWNAVSWSISAEWFAYLTFPVALAISLRYRTRPAILVALTAAGLVLLVFLVRRIGGTGLFHLQADYAMLRIAPEFMLGCALYGLGRRFSLGAQTTTVGVAAVTAAIVVGAHVSAPDTALVLGGAALVFLMAETSRNGSLAWLASPRLVYLGEISYSTYMIHGVVQVAYFAVAARLGGWPAAAMPPMLVLPAILLVHLGSVASYGWAERPGRFRLHAVLRQENLFRAAPAEPAHPTQPLPAATAPGVSLASP